MFRLKSMRIDKFRNVEPGTTLEFNEGINLVLGKNATGKTTLLELIVAATKWNFSCFDKEELDITTVSSFDNIAVNHCVRHSRFATKRRDSRPVEVIRHGGVLEMSSPSWSVVANADHGLCVIQQTDNNKMTRPYLGADWESSVVDEVVSGTNEHSFAEFHLLLDARNDFRNDLRRLDESLNAINEQSQSTLEYHRLSEFEFMLVAPGFPRDLRDIIFPELYKFTDLLVATDQNIEYLTTARRMLGVDEVKTTFRLQNIDETVVLRYSDQDFLITRGGSSYSFEQFSYGQQRLIAILQYLATNMQIVVADEITNGLHHAWIEEIVGMLNGRQCFLTTQNPLLLDYLTFESAPEVRQRMIRCEQQADQKLVWRNLTNEEAEDFFASSQVGIQHISEIMKTHGLW
jgi:AAA domain, putative AbiEii toxin, Type IV TA system